MNIQIFMPKEISDKIKIEKVKRNFNTQEETIIYILNKFFGGNNGNRKD